MIHYKELIFMPKIILTNLINCYYNNLLMGYFGINKIWELIIWKYSKFSLYKNIKTYIKSCNIFLIFQAVTQKPYNNLLILLILTH